MAGADPKTDISREEVVREGWGREGSGTGRRESLSVNLTEAQAIWRES